MKTKRTKATEQTVLGAIAEGAVSLTQIYRAHGGKGCISGSDSRKYRQLVPDLDARLEAAKNGTPAAPAAPETPAPKAAAKPKRAKRAAKPKAAKPKGKTVANATTTQAELFRGEVYKTVYGVGAEKERTWEDTLDAAEAQGLDRQSAEFCLRVLCNPGHRSNRDKAHPNGRVHNRLYDETSKGRKNARVHLEAVSE